MQLTVQLDANTAAFGPADRPSHRLLEVASMFGLGLDRSRTLAVVPRTTITLAPAQIVFITGPSGSGKSTLLRLLREALARTLSDRPLPVHDFADLPEPRDLPLVDALDTPTLADALAALSVAGLNDAFVMLRTPRQLSDGQRYRFKLAQVIATLPQQPPGETDPSHPRAVILADEFGATLDRMTAAVIAKNLRRWVSAARVCLVAATTHDDLLEPLDPDTLIEQHLTGTLTLAHKPT